MKHMKAAMTVLATVTVLAAFAHETLARPQVVDSQETTKLSATQAESRDSTSGAGAWIGIKYQQITPEIADALGLNSTKGALVSDLLPKSPAADAGIVSGDVITSLNGIDVSNGEELARLISKMSPGDTVSIGVIHAGAHQAIQIKLAAEPPELYRCDEGDSPGSNFTPIMTVARVFQLAFEIRGRLSPCTIVLASHPDVSVGEPVASIGGREFVERVPGPKKCYYTMGQADEAQSHATKPNDLDAVIVFDNLSPEYRTRVDGIGIPRLDVLGAGPAVCPKFRDGADHGVFTDSGTDTCYETLTFKGALTFSPALRALRYIFSEVCPHAQFRPY
jgi:hypothetical protein